MFPFCKKKSLTRAERLKQTVTRGVSDGVHQLLDRVPVKELEVGAHHALEVAQQAASQAGHALHDASHTVKGAVLQAVQQAAARAEEADAAARARAAADQIASSAAHSAHHASERARHAYESVGEAAAHWRESAVAAAHRARASAEEAREAAEEASSRAAATARHAAEEAAEAAREAAAAARNTAASRAALAAGLASTLGETLSHSLDGARGQLKDRLHHEAAEVEAIVPHAVSRLHLSGDHDVQIRETNSRWLWILLGIAVGALLALLFAPTSGRRSRAAIQDRLSRVRKNTQDALAEASDKAADISNRAHGLAHRVEQKLHHDGLEEVSDATLADKVRTALGGLPQVQDLPRINVEAADGTVTLRGPMVTDEVRGAIEACVKSVPGVGAVISDFLTEEANPDPAQSVG